MFSDILATSVEQLAHDCMLLCEQHYPTIHSRGMQENHLAKTLCRRIITNAAQTNISLTAKRIEDSHLISQAIYRLQYDNTCIWVIAHHFVSANKARREALLNTIALLQQSFAPDEQHYLMIVADHWFDRSKASKEIPAWWLGELPANHQDYATVGLKLQACDDSLANSVTQRFNYSAGSMALQHPFQRTDDQSPVLRYLFLTAIYKID
ncbi:hypothetical protein ACN08P_20360 [Photobacterium leiognathi subsp. mandapamensis]|uniref:hypothetical protein n=1 Tax=Photobacterium leiognathi TaxID=553611 RepID=UPI003AF392DB